MPDFRSEIMAEVQKRNLAVCRRPQKRKAEGRIETSEDSRDAWQAEYGRITVRIQKRERGFAFQFIDRVSGEILAEEHTLEVDREKAQDQAVDRAGELLANQQRRHG
jgi:hypothetical protein